MERQPSDAISIPPAAQGTIALLQAKGHTVTVRRNRHGSNRYTLDSERERNAHELHSRYDRLYPPTAIERCYAK